MLFCAFLWPINSPLPCSEDTAHTRSSPSPCRGDGQTRVDFALAGEALLHRLELLGVVLVEFQPLAVGGLVDGQPALAAALDGADHAVVDFVPGNGLKPVGTTRRRGCFRLFLCLLCLFVAIPRNRGLLRVSVVGGFLPLFVRFARFAVNICIYLCFLEFLVAKTGLVTKEHKERRAKREFSTFFSTKKESSKENRRHF